MLKTLSLKAFKSFPDASIEFKPLTLFSGLNNSGKSSVIQALRMYNNANGGVSPLLDGHGSVEDMRSKLSSSSASIEITCGFEDGDSSTLKLSDDSIEEPAKSPVCCYVGADRFGPQAVLPLNRSFDKFPHIGNQGEFVLDFLGQLNYAIIPEILHHDLSEGNSLEFELRGWLSEIAPNINFSYDTNQKTDSANAEIDGFRPTNVGFGLSYTLPVLVAILGMSSQAPSTGWRENWGEEWDQMRHENGVMIIIENPEAHLHPHGQTAMGRLIALAAASGVQVVVETHSDHLMDGIRIATKDQLIQADSIAFHYLSKNTDGYSEIITPRIHQSGKLDSWPEGFFDQTLKNRASLAKRS